MPKTPSAPRLSYTVHGAAGPAVVLVMGLGMRGLVWRPQVEGLRGDHRLVTFDHRGIGASEDDGRPFRIRDLAGDVCRVMDAVGWDSAHVVGVSMGGMVAQELALEAPSRLRSLILIATSAGGPLGFLPPPRGVAGFLGVNLLPEKRRFGALASLLYPRSFLRVADRDALERRMQDQVGERATPSIRRRQVRAVMGHDTRARLRAIVAPTLVISCGADVLVPPARQRWLAGAIPGARHLHLPYAGHGVIFQCAPVVNRAIAHHVATHEPHGGPRTLDLRGGRIGH